MRTRIKRYLKPFQPHLQRLVAPALPNSLTHPIWSHRASYTYCQDLVALTKHNLKMVLPGDDLSVTPSIALSGEFEPQEERFVARIVRGGDWVVDVGANVGLYTLIAASACGPFGRVFALEPNEQARRYIEKSSLLNFLHDRIRILPFAASDGSGEALLEGMPCRLGDFRHKQDLSKSGAFDLTVERSKRSCQKLVKLAKLDDIFSFDLPIKLMKIDAEGHEAQILRGARRLFRNKCIQYLMIEVSRSTSGLNFVELIKTLRELNEWGYCACSLDRDGSLAKLTDFERQIPPSGHLNVIFHALWQ